MSWNVYLLLVGSISLVFLGLQFWLAYPAMCNSVLHFARIYQAPLKVGGMVGHGTLSMLSISAQL